MERLRFLYPPPSPYVYSVHTQEQARRAGAATGERKRDHVVHDSFGSFHISDP